MNGKQILAKMDCLIKANLSLVREMKKLRAQVRTKAKRRIIQKQIQRPIFILEAIKVEEEVIEVEEEVIVVEVAVEAEVEAAVEVAVDIDVAIDIDVEEAVVEVDTQPMPVVLEERIKKKRANIDRELSWNLIPENTILRASCKGTVLFVIKNNKNGLTEWVDNRYGDKEFAKLSEAARYFCITLLGNQSPPSAWELFKAYKASDGSVRSIKDINDTNFINDDYIWNPV